MNRVLSALCISAIVCAFTFFSGCKDKDDTPTLSTLPGTSATAISVVTGGTIISDGGAPITEKGICWSTAANPTIADKIVACGSGLGNFVAGMDYLSSGTEFHVRAYATSAHGTAYGNDVIVTTLSAVPANGLVGWWPFNGGAQDESGNEYDGTIFGATPAVDRFGSVNSAYYYDGVSSYISLPPDPVTTTSDYTISIWVNPTTTPLSGEAVNVFVTGYPDSELDYGLTFDNNYSSSGVTGFIVGGYTSPSTGEATTTGAVPEANHWYHIVAVRTSTTAKIYYNGSIWNTNAVTGSPVSYQCNTCVSYVGIRTNLIQPFHGLIDDLAVYNRALTDEEVSKIYISAGF